MYDARTRDRFRAVVGALTGVAAVASATAAGIVTGMAADATEADQAAPDSPTGAWTDPGEPGDRAVETAPRSRPRTVIRWKERPRRTEVHTRTVYRVVPSTGATLGGGSVTSTSTGPTGSGYTSTSPGGGGSGPPPSNGGTGGGGGGSQTSPPAPPPPPAPPAPSTGS